MLANAIELGSVHKAALSQCVTAQAVSQALQQLEKYLGVLLLNRTIRRLSHDGCLRASASLGNWVRLSAKGELSGAGGGDKGIQVSTEQIEIARLRAENV